MIGFAYRCIACNIGILATYPIETLKVKVQTNENVPTFAGIEAPVIFSSLTNGMRFQIFTMIKPYSFLLAVLIAGIYNGIVEIPYHNIKLERQLGRPLFKGGWEFIFYKELIGTFLHFYSYNTIHTDNEIIHFLLGGGTAVAAMTVVYPLETFFVNYKTKRKGITDTITETIEKNTLWKGYYYNMIRIFVGYSITMYLQDMINVI